MGASLVFLFGIINDANQYVAILTLEYSYFKFSQLVVVGGKVEDVVSPICIIAGVMHFESIHSETFTVGLRQIAISNIEPECLQHFLNFLEFVKAALYLHL